MANILLIFLVKQINQPILLLYLISTSSMMKMEDLSWLMLVFMMDGKNFCSTFYVFLYSKPLFINQIFWEKSIVAL